MDFCARKKGVKSHYEKSKIRCLEVQVYNQNPALPWQALSNRLLKHTTLFKCFDLMVQKVFSVSGPMSRGKLAVICYASSSNGFVEKSLLLCGKKLS